MESDKLVGKNMRRWELDERLRARFERDASTCPACSRVVTISRQLGSGGTHVANLLAQELDYQVYDKDVVSQVAETWGADPEQIAWLDEQQPDMWGNLVLQLLEGKRSSEATYLRTLVKVIKKIASQGNAIIVGRAATCILHDSYRVRLVAPEALRIERIAEIRKADEKTARRMVQDSDRQRTRFIRTFFGGDPKDPLAYDIVINTERCTLDDAAHLIKQGVMDRQALVMKKISQAK